MVLKKPWKRANTSTKLCTTTQNNTFSKPTLVSHEVHVQHKEVLCKTHNTHTHMYTHTHTHVHTHTCTHTHMYTHTQSSMVHIEL